MSQDQQTYARATTASLIGFVTQLLLTVLVGVLGAYAGSKAVIAAAFYLVPGLWVWVLLWMLYKQHRLEREEALEAARLADADARSAALFEEAGHQLAQAKRRLENLYKWAMPLVSLLTAVYLLAVGGLLLYLNNNALQDQSLVAAPIKQDVNTSLLALLLVVAWMAGFLVSRYVAGMTRVDAWQALRGGASTLIGHVFLGILPLLVATALLFFDNDAGFVYLAIALPVVMILLGVEIVLGLVLGFYRPRKAGVFYRPAFDSRVLGWLTRPESIGKIFSETINYQFGFEVSKSWFMRLLGKALLPLAIVCVAVIVAMTSVVIVEPHQQAVVTRNGAFVRIAEPGLSFKAPWPFGEAQKFDVNRVHSIRLGSRAHLDDEHAVDGPILWTNPHVQEGETEELLITAPSRVASEAGDRDSVLGEMIGADIDVKYRIADLRQYAGIDNHTQGSTEPVQLLESIAQHEVTRYFATHDTETLMSAGRAVAGRELQAAIQAKLKAFNTGLEVVFVSVSGVHPPQDVAEDYHGRINALQEQQTAIENARQEAESILAGLAGSRERADQLAALIDGYKALEIEKQRLDPSDAARAARVQAQLDQQKAAIEQMMSDSGGQIGQRLAEARALRWTLSMREQARYIQRGTDDEAYRAAPRYFVVSRYLDTLANAMADRPKTIFAPAPDDDEPGVVIEHPLGGSPGLNLP
ncbi:MAG: SPFH domain-containing protein [Phycisphaeraceae bacterium]